MNNMIEQMLDQYDAETVYEKKNAVKESRTAAHPIT